MIIAFAFKANVDTYLQAAVYSIHGILNELNEIDCTERNVGKGSRGWRYKPKGTKCKEMRIEEHIFIIFYIFSVIYIQVYMCIILIYKCYLYTYSLLNTFKNNQYLPEYFAI